MLPMMFVDACVIVRGPTGSEAPAVYHSGSAVFGETLAAQMRGTVYCASP